MPDRKQPAWKGWRRTVLDQFDGGSDVTLESTGDWTKQTGNGSIREDGAGTAYTTSVGASPTHTFYLNDKGKCWNNRKVECDVSVPTNTIRAGVLLAGRGAAMKNKFVVYAIKNGTNTDFYSLYATGGVDVGPNYLGQISGTGFIHVVLRRHGNKVFWDINNKGITGNLNVGDAGRRNDRAGLYMLRPAVSFGFGNKAEWQNFDVRLLGI